MDQHERELEEHKRGPAHEPRPGEPSGGPEITRVLAGLGLGLATLLLVGSFVLVTFAQILPAVVVFGASIGLGAFSLAGLYREPREDTEAVGPSLTHGARASAFVQPPDVDNPSTRSVAVWAATALLAIVAIGAGLMLFSDVQLLTGRNSLWFYPGAFRWTAGAVALFGGIALMFPRISKMGALVLLPVAFGAVYTPLARGRAAAVVLPLCFLLLLLFVLWDRTRTGQHWAEAHHRGVRGPR